MTKFKKYKKVTKNNARIIWKAQAHLQTMEKTCAKSKKISIKLYEELCSRGTHCLYIEGEKWLSSQWGRSEKKKNLTITSKPHTHPHTMKKTHKKFHNNQYKTVRGVALTRGINCLYIKDEKWLSSQCRKSDKKWSNNYIQTTCTSSYHYENIRKVSKRSVQVRQKVPYVKLWKTVQTGFDH